MPVHHETPHALVHVVEKLATRHRQEDVNGLVVNVVDVCKVMLMPSRLTASQTNSLSWRFASISAMAELGGICQWRSCIINLQANSQQQ